MHDRSSPISRPCHHHSPQFRGLAVSRIFSEKVPEIFFMIFPLSVNMTQRDLRYDGCPVAVRKKAKKVKRRDKIKSNNKYRIYRVEQMEGWYRLRGNLAMGKKHTVVNETVQKTHGYVTPWALIEPIFDVLKLAVSCPSIRGSPSVLLHRQQSQRRVI